MKLPNHVWQHQVMQQIQSGENWRTEFLNMKKAMSTSIATWLGVILKEG